MDKLIKPLSDFLKTYPDISATAIILISGIATFLAGMYVIVEQREKKQLNQSLTLESAKTKGNQEDKRRLEEQEQRITQILADLKDYQKKLEQLQRDNVNLEVDLKLTQGQKLLRKMIEANQSGIQDVEQLISRTQDMRAAVKSRIAKQSQRRKPRIMNFINQMTGKHK